MRGFYKSLITLSLMLWAVANAQGRIFPPGTPVGIRLPKFAPGGVSLICPSLFKSRKGAVRITLCLCKVTGETQCPCPPTFFRKVNLCACHSSATTFSNNKCGCKAPLKMDNFGVCQSGSTEGSTSGTTVPETRIFPAGTKVGIRLPMFAPGSTSLVCPSPFSPRLGGSRVTLCLCKVSGQTQCPCPPTFFRKVNLCSCHPSATIFSNNKCGCKAPLKMDKFGVCQSGSSTNAKPSGAQSQTISIASVNRVLPVGTPVGIRLPAFAPGDTSLVCPSLFISRKGASRVTLCLCRVTSETQCPCPPTFFRKVNLCLCHPSATTFRNNKCGCKAPLTMDATGVCRCIAPAVLGGDGKCTVASTSFSSIIISSTASSAKSPSSSPPQSSSSSSLSPTPTPTPAPAPRPPPSPPPERILPAGTRVGIRLPTFAPSGSSLVCPASLFIPRSRPGNPVTLCLCTVTTETQCPCPPTFFRSINLCKCDSSTSTFIDNKCGCTAPLALDDFGRCWCAPPALENANGECTAPKLKGAEITGQVFQDNNKDKKIGNTEGIPGLSVQLLSQDGTVINVDGTTYDGVFRFQDLARGTYTIVVPTVPEGLIPTIDSDGNADGKTVVKVDKPVVTTVNFGYEKHRILFYCEPDRIHNHITSRHGRQRERVTVAGSVWEDKIENYRKDLDEGIGRITVRLQFPNGFLVGRVITDRDGDFTLSALPGKYNVLIDTQEDFKFVGNSINTTSLSLPVTLVKGNPVVDLGFRLKFVNPDLRGSVSGIVWRDANSNGFADDGEGMPNMVVIVQDNNGKEKKREITDENGAYQFIKLPQGRQLIQAFGNVQGYRWEDNDVIKRATAKIDLTIGQQMEDLDFKLVDKDECTGRRKKKCPKGTKCINTIGAWHCGCELNYKIQKNICVPTKAKTGGSVSGRVFVDKNGNGEMDPDEMANGASIFLFNVLTNEQVSTTISKDNGKFRMTGLQKGSYRIQVAQPSSGSEPLVDPDSGPNSDPNGQYEFEMTILRAITDLNFGFIPTIRASPLNIQFDKNPIDSIERLNASLPKAVSTITGLAFRDANDDGVIQEGEVMLKGVRIRVQTLENKLVTTGFSDSNGLYAFNLPPGRYVLNASPPPNHRPGSTLPKGQVRVSVRPFMVFDRTDFPWIPK